MEVEQLIIPKEKAELEYKAFLQLVKSRKTEYHEQLHKIYGHMKHGRAIIDVLEAIKKAGLNKDSDPKLALCTAHSNTVVFEKHLNGKGTFYRAVKYNRVRTYNKPVLTCPEFTFPVWKTKEGEIASDRWTIHNQRRQAPVPIIPASILAPLKGQLRHFHILWEVEKWEPLPPKDPILLKQLSNTIFVVLATWELTEVERAVIRGRLNELLWLRN